MEEKIEAQREVSKRKREQEDDIRKDFVSRRAQQFSEGKVLRQVNACQVVLENLDAKHGIKEHALWRSDPDEDREDEPPEGQTEFADLEVGQYSEQIFCQQSVDCC
jgi:hypothetical protein